MQACYDNKEHLKSLPCVYIFATCFFFSFFFSSWNLTVVLTLWSKYYYSRILDVENEVQSTEGVLMVAEGVMSHPILTLRSNHCKFWSEMIFNFSPYFSWAPSPTTMCLPCSLLLMVCFYPEINNPEEGWQIYFNFTDNCPLWQKTNLKFYLEELQGYVECLR